MAEAPAPEKFDWRDWAPYAGLIVLNFLFHWPAILNAAGLQSDSAIVGLQARHLLNGESSRFLWGLDYEGTFDVYVLAALFKIVGATPLMLLMGPFIGHLLMSVGALGVLIKELGKIPAFLVSLVIVFTPHSINGVATAAPRQWSITFVILGTMLMAWRTERLAPLRIFSGALLALLSLYLDLFTMMFIPGAALLGVMACFDHPREKPLVAARAMALAFGAALGVFLVRTLRDSGAPKAQGIAVSLDAVARSWPLMKEQCLPWLLGLRIYVPGSNLYPDVWESPLPLKVFQWAAVTVFFVISLLSTALVFTRRVPWEVKRLGLFGAGTAGTSLVGFLVSGWPWDMWGARYLAPILWAMPFTLAPLAKVLRPRGLAVLLVPYLCVAAFSGWMFYGPWVNGPLPQSSPRGSAVEEQQVGEYLRSRGFQWGFAQYWLAYRLSYLWQENPTLAALDGDRYPPFHQAAERASKQAFVFHPSEPRAQPQMVIPALQARGGRTEVVQVAGFTLVLWSAQ